MDASENKDPDQQAEALNNGMEEEELHHSDRQWNPTEKMTAYKKEEAQKKEKRLIQLYEQWNGLARNTREELKTDISESLLIHLRREGRMSCKSTWKSEITSLHPVTLDIELILVKLWQKIFGR